MFKKIIWFLVRLHVRLALVFAIVTLAMGWSFQAVEPVRTWVLGSPVLKLADASTGEVFWQFQPMHVPFKAAELVTHWVGEHAGAFVMSVLGSVL